MTIEHKIVVGVDDIKAVIVACTCGIRFSMSPDDIQIPANCPKCGIIWGGKPCREISSEHEEWASANLNFADAIGRMRKHPNSGFRLLLEFEREPSLLPTSPQR
jgi:hypothetical protein